MVATCRIKGNNALSVVLRSLKVGFWKDSVRPSRESKQIKVIMAGNPLAAFPRGQGTVRLHKVSVVDPGYWLHLAYD